MFGLFEKKDDVKPVFSVTIDGEVVYVDEKVWRHINKLKEKINELQDDNSMMKCELNKLKPIVTAKGYKPAISEDCADCRYVVLNHWNKQPVGCRKENVCEDFTPREAVGEKGGIENE